MITSQKELHGRWYCSQLWSVHSPSTLLLQWVVKVWKWGRLYLFLPLNSSIAHFVTALMAPPVNPTLMDIKGRCVGNKSIPTSEILVPRPARDRVNCPQSAWAMPLSLACHPESTHHRIRSWGGVSLYAGIRAMRMRSLRGWMYEEFLAGGALGAGHFEYFKEHAAPGGLIWTTTWWVFFGWSHIVFRRFGLDQLDFWEVNAYM